MDPEREAVDHLRVEFMTRRPDEIAVVLSGGGAYGAFGIGVLKALFAGRSPATGYRPLEPGIFSGTSVGSFNAAVLVSHQGSTLDASLHLERIWTERVSSLPGERGNGIFRVRGDVSDYPDFSSPTAVLNRFASDSLSIGRYVLGRTANFLASSRPLENRAIALVNIEDFIDPSPLHDLLHDTINPKDIRNSPKRLRIVATNWLTGEVKLFDNTDFEGDRGFLGVMASTAIPGVFPPIEVAGGICVDGGVVQNTPLNPALQLGAKELHVICLNPDPKEVPLRGQPSTIDTVMRVYFMLLEGKLEEDIETARWINQGLEVFERILRGDQIAGPEVVKLLKVAGQIFVGPTGKPLNRVVIHKYLPQSSLGGDLGLLNFDRDQVLYMIEQGEHEAMNHNCQTNNCVLDSD
jgi:predicted acylesterase/phospholipase RssA